MRLVTVVLIACVATSAVWGLAGPQSPSGSKSVQRLIDQLGSPKFSERDKAMKELRARDPAVLPALRNALKSSPALEIRQRIELLVNRLEDRELAARLLEPKRVRLRLMNATVAEAVDELAKRSGYPIHLSDTASTAGHKVTLDTGETTFWDAFEKLCTAARVVENQAVMGPFDAELGMPGVQDWRSIIKAATGIHLKAGKPASTPSCLVGSIRIRLLRVKVSSDRTVDLVLEVSGEPGLRGLGLAHPPRLSAKRDGRGETLVITPVSEPAGSSKTDMLAHRGGGWVEILMDNTVLKGNCFATAPTVGEGPFLTRVRFTLPEKVARFKELTGKLVLLTTVEARTPLTLPNILQAAGKSVNAADGSQLLVEKVEPLPKGDLRLKVAWQRPTPGNGPLGFRGIGGMMRAHNGIIEISGVPSDGSPAVLADAPLLLDRDGKGYLLTEWRSQGWTITRAQMVHRLTLVYRPQPGQGPPSRLVSPGQRAVPFEVAFKFTDIRLP